MVAPAPVRVFCLSLSLLSGCGVFGLQSESTQSMGRSADSTNLLFRSLDKANTSELTMVNAGVEAVEAVKAVEAEEPTSIEPYDLTDPSVLLRMKKTFGSTTEPGEEQQQSEESLLTDNVERPSEDAPREEKCRYHSQHILKKDIWEAAESNKDSPLQRNGDKTMIISICALSLGVTLIVTLIFDIIRTPKEMSSGYRDVSKSNIEIASNEERKMKTGPQGVNAGLTRGEKSRRLFFSLVPLMMLCAGLGLTWFCLSLYMGQDYKICYDNKRWYPNRNKLVFDGWMWYAVTMFAVGSSYLIAAAVVYTCFPGPQRLAGGVDTLTGGTMASAMPIGGPGQARTRLFELDHMKYFSMCWVVAMHLATWNTLQHGIINGFIAFGLGFGLLSFVVASGYNFPAFDVKARHKSRIVHTGLLYLWNNALLLLFIYLVLRPIALSLYDRKYAVKITKRLSDSDHDYLVGNVYKFVQRIIEMPLSVLWYLQSLFAWMLFSPLWIKLKFPLTGAIVLSFFAQWGSRKMATNPYNPFWTLLYFPYFILGVQLKQHGYDKYLIEWSKHYTSKTVSRATILIYLAFCMRIPYSIGETWNIIAWPWGTYEFTIESNIWYFNIARIGYMLASLGILYAVYTAMPSCETYFSRASKFTMVAYIFHIWIVFTLVTIGFYGRIFAKDYSKNPVPLQLNPTVRLYVTIIVLTVPNVLMWPPVAKMLGLLASPPFLLYFFKTSNSTKVSKKAKTIASLGGKSVPT
ncbi:hypothetical protein AAMO2058_001675800 [Amorphochlora amoebiformis]